MKSLFISSSATALFAAVAAAEFVYNPSEWPTINFPLEGAPVPTADAAMLAAVGFTPTAGLPVTVPKTSNPLTGGPPCPADRTPFGSTGSCWWTCGYSADQTNCATASDVKGCAAGPGHWGLSYDDGPTNMTDTILDTLKANNLKATFCLVGSQVLRFPKQAKRIYDEGHDLCGHTWSHSALTTLTNEQVIAEFKWTEKAIEATTGAKVKYIRAPMGDQDNRIRAIAEKMGYKLLLWDFDTSDFQAWQTTPPPVPVPQIINGINTALSTRANEPKGIIALGHPEKDAKGPGIMETMIKAAAGKVKLLPVSACLNDPKPFQAVAAPPASVKPTGGKSAASSLGTNVMLAAVFSAIVATISY